MGWLIGATNFPGAWYASLTEVSLPSPKLIIGGHLRRVKACSVVENDFLTLCRQLIEIAVLVNVAVNHELVDFALSAVVSATLPRPVDLNGMPDIKRRNVYRLERRSSKAPY